MNKFIAEVHSLHDKETLLIKMESKDTLAQRLRSAVETQSIDRKLCIEAADFVDSAIAQLQTQFEFNYNENELDYIALFIFKITRKSHKVIIKYLIKNIGKIVLRKDLCEMCGITPGTLKVQISHMRSNLKEAGAIGVLQNVRANRYCSDNGYMIMPHEFRKLLDMHEMQNQSTKSSTLFMNNVDRLFLSSH